MMIANEVKAGRREWIGLAVLMLPLLLVSMDVSVLYFAVPFIVADLAPSSTQQLWIFDVYGFVLAGLLITMGALGDRIGRRRLLLIGAGAFALTSVVAAYSQSAGMLIGARAVLGIGGATLMPSTLALIRTMFHDAKQRGTAIAIWTAGLTSGVALGPIMSGFLLEHFWWGSVFLINVPFMVLLLVLGPRLLPEFRDPAAGRLDIASAVLSLATVLPIIYGIKEIAADGVDPLRLVGIAGGLVIGGLFVLRQRTAARPMLDVRMFRVPRFSAAVIANLAAMFAMAGYAIFTTQYLQLVLGLSPLTAALWSVAPAILVGGAAPAAMAMVQAGVRRSTVIAGGFVLAAAGLAVLTQVRVDSALWVVLVGAGLLFAGLVVVMSLTTELLIGTVTTEQAGSASAISEAGSELGGALGIAILGSIGAAVYRSRLVVAFDSARPAGFGAARETLAGALATARQLPAGPAAALREAARIAFVGGMNTVAAVAGIALLVIAVIAAFALRETAPDRAAVPVGEAADRGPAAAEVR